ncbi:MAG: hypothetical protein V2A55_01000 [Candidatus Jorgensenbacteria bacterium]
MAFSKRPVIKFVKYVLSFFELFLGLRLILRLLGANPSTPIVDLLYTLTDTIMIPFQGIFSNMRFQNGSVLDVVAITSMIGYPIIVYLLIELIDAIAKEKKRGVGDIEI